MSSQNQLPNLDKIFRDEEEPDFVPSGGSNLAAIFGLQPKPTDVSNKQTITKKNNTRCSTQQTVPHSMTKLLMAKVVHAYKLQNGQYVSMGNLGLALSGNITTKVYQLILYKVKQEYISVATVTHDFVYTVQANNYASYYDNNKDNWSILFNNNESYLEFAIEIGLARYFVTRQEKEENIIYQDLMPSNENIIAKEGDKVCLKYFIGTEIVQPCNMNVMSQTMTVEISTDDNWERILLGAGKGLKRVLFLPPSKQISLGPGFPKERDIMLVIEITDIQISEEKSPPSPKVPISGKASIISRMAKMGQSILPKMPLPSTTDSEDTEDDAPHESPRHKRIEQSEATSQRISNSSQKSPKKCVAQKVAEQRTEVPPVDSSSTFKPLVANSPLTSQWTSPYFGGHYMMMDNPMYPMSQTMNRAIPATLDPTMNMLLSETRMTNAEIRMGLSKISDNVQKLLDKFYALELQNATTPTNEKAALDASLKMFLAFNASRTETVDNISSKAPDQNVSDDKIKEAQSRISALEDSLKKSKEENESLSCTNETLSKKLKELEERLVNTSDELLKAKADLETAEGTIKRYKENNVDLEERLAKCKRDNVLHTDTMSSKQKDIENKNKEIKQIMNKTYHTLLEKLAESHSDLPFDYVKSIIGSTIKNITLQVLQEGCENTGSETSNNADFAAPKTEEHTDKILDVADNNPSVKPVEFSRSNITIMPVFQKEPPPVPRNDIDETDVNLEQNNTSSVVYSMLYNMFDNVPDMWTSDGTPCV